LEAIELLVEPALALGVGEQRGPGVELVDPVVRLDDLVGVDLDVGGLPSAPADGLVGGSPWS
jgi:hypothetical protein